LNIQIRTFFQELAWGVNLPGTGGSHSPEYTIDFSRQIVTFNNEIETRSLKLPTEFFNVLREILEDNAAFALKDVWYSNWKGEREKWSRKTAYNKVVALMDKAGIDCNKRTPNAIRHGYAVYNIINNVPLRTLQYNMGHSSMATTASYVDNLKKGGMSSLDTG
jgi:site-specific recombinase XerD